MKLATSASGAIEKTFGNEIGLLAGICGSLMRIRLSGMDENIIRQAAMMKSVLLWRFKAMSKLPSPKDRQNTTS